MKNHLTSLHLDGADVLAAGQLVKQPVVVQDGIVMDPSHAMARTRLDLSGYLVLPGIIDLHGDCFERHLAPRPSAPFPVHMGLTGVDRDAAANGITTAWLAQSWSWEGGSRGPDAALALLTALDGYQPRAMTDLRVQLRCETYTVDTQDSLLNAVRTFGIDYVIFNNHLPEAVTLADKAPAAFAAWGARAGRDPDAHLALVNATLAHAPKVPRYLCNLATAFDAHGVRYGSHDDPDAATREYYAMIGASICEFPTAYAPAKLAMDRGHPVLLGAPNVVRGGSQAGNISAETLIRQGLCTALVSDYHYPALAAAAFALVDRGTLPLAQAWAMISTAPARIMRLRDRGVIRPGLRADLVIVDAETRQIEGTLSNGRWAHLCGALAAQIAHHPRMTLDAAE